MKKRVILTGPVILAVLVLGCKTQSEDTTSKKDSPVLAVSKNENPKSLETKNPADKKTVVTATPKEDDQPAQLPRPRDENDNKENLKKYFVDLYKAAHEGKYKKAASLTISLFPTEDQVKDILKSSIDASKLKAIHENSNRYRPENNDPDGEVAMLFVENRKKSNVIVYEASTEDLIAYKEGTDAYEQFPGGAKSAAEKVLRPGAVFYEVVMAEPGQTRGMKYHMMFWNGESWSMLGRPWRVLED